MPDYFYITSYAQLLVFLAVIAAFVLCRFSLSLLRAALIVLCISSAIPFWYGVVRRGIMGSAFDTHGPSALFVLFSLLPFAYYLFCIVTAFSRPPRRLVAALVHLFAAGFFVFVNSSQTMPGMGSPSMRIAMSIGGVFGLLPLILIWMRIYDLRNRTNDA
jgi:hypothetical protein